MRSPSLRRARSRVFVSLAAVLGVAVAPTLAAVPAVAADGPPIVINEVDPANDWVELTNTGTETVDISGFLIKDDVGTRAVVKAGTTLAPGAFYAIDTEAAEGDNLDTIDSARLLTPTETLLDSYAWTTATATSFGRCADGTGAFRSTVATSKAAANVCARDDGTIDLTFLNINDFHGRIDANTVRFAGTVEQERAKATGPVSFVSAGDNIGASLFASAVAKDQPTIDVLNALGLAASAVGNHEFDQGFADLTDRVIPASDFPYLGANVYLAGTTTPALEEYTTFDMGGVTVAVIGAVTEETPSLVSPGGITALEFGDPVEAVNRVTAQLTDGDPGNGEADVIVAEFHEGAGSGAPDGSSLAQEVAAGGAFAAIVEDTSADVDVIFTGHTHKQYAWEAPIPGDETRKRPILQTGSYGEFVGKVVLNYDPATDEVVSHTQANVARIPAPTPTAPSVSDAQLVAAYPRVAQVSSIVTTALAYAATVGEEPVGSVTADITTAYTGGSYVGGVYTGSGPTPSTGRDTRESESTLGDLVADALVETLAEPRLGGAEIGVVNPGGLRAELFYAPDGVITYGEANSVLPFANNLWTTTLTGAQFKTLLEQQWQPAGSSRAYLQLGLSDNVTYTFDPAAPAGSHITSITVDGAPIDPAAAYRIGTFSFLLTGGDNFFVFTQGTGAADSGLVDRDAWIAYLQANPGLEPDFARQAVQVPAVPTSVQAGTALDIDVAGLDLTSLGSPQNTSLQVRLDGASIGTVTVTNGAATVDATVPAGTANGAHVLTLVAAPSGTTVTFPVTVTGGTTPTDPTDPTDPGTTPTPVPGDQLVEGNRGSVTAPASAAPGQQIVIDVGVQYAGETVTVWLYSDPQLIATATVAADGTVRATIPAGTPAGTHRIAVLDAEGNLIGWTEITVTGSLPATGLDSGPIVSALGAGLVLIAGGALLAARRRRETGDA